MTKILDSTLRDGAYAFGNSMPMAYVKSIAKNLDQLVDYIEVGSAISFGYGSPTALVDDLKRLCTVDEILTSSQSAIFIQPSLWHELGSPDLASLFAKPPGLIRIGIDPELDPSVEEDLITECRELSIPVSINLMKAYKYDQKMFDYIVKVTSGSADIVSIVDSSGCMTLEEVLTIVSNFSCQIKASFAIHVHNNLGYANQISMSCMQKGIFADSTLLGKGRAGGNSDTCLLVIQRALDRGYDIDKLDAILESLFLSTQPVWGDAARTHLIDILLGVTSLHSAKLRSSLSTSLQLLPTLRSMLNVAWIS